MKKYTQHIYILVFFILSTFLIASAHQPIHSLKEIPNKVFEYQTETRTKNSVVFMDLDDTLIKSVHPNGWGSDKWFSAMYSYLKTNNISNPLDIIFGVVTFVNAFFADQNHEQFIIKTEDLAPDVITNLKRNSIPVFGLTARTFILKEFTQTYLNDLEIIFSRLHIPEAVLNDETAWKAIYANGTIFCSGNNKGKIILDFFDKFKINTSNLSVFAVDDQEANLDKIKQMLESRGISCVCLHYLPGDAQGFYQLDPTTLAWLDLIVKSNQRQH